MQMNYQNAQQNEPYIMVSLASTNKILLCGAISKEQKCHLMVYLNYCKLWFLKIVNPSYLGSYYSIISCSTIVTCFENTFIWYILKGTKTPIKYLMGKCHFKWLTNYKTNYNVIYLIWNTF